MLLNSKFLNEAFIQNENVICLAENTKSILNPEQTWDVYNILTWEGATLFECWESNESAAIRFIRNEATFNAYIQGDAKLLFVAKNGTNKVALAILTNFNSNLTIIPYLCDDSRYNCNFRIQFAPNYTAENGVNDFNLVLNDNFRPKLKFSDINNFDGLVIKQGTLMGICFSLLPENKKEINIPKGVEALARGCFNIDVLKDFTINIPSTVNQMDAFAINVNNIKGATFNFEMKAEDVKKAMDKDWWENFCELQESGLITVTYLDSFETEDDFKAFIFDLMEEINNSDITTEKIQSVLKKCFNYYKISNEENLPSDIREGIERLNKAFSDKLKLQKEELSNKFYFKINGNEAWLVDYFGKESEMLIIPETYKGKLVTRLEKYSLNTPYTERIQTLVLPKGIKHLGRNCIYSVKKILTVANPKKISCNKNSILTIDDIDPEEGNNLYEVYPMAISCIKTISQAEYDDFLEKGSK